MMMAVALSTALTAGAQGQRWSSEDSAMVARIHDHVLGQGGCVEDLRVLCKEVGARLSGSPEADAAILWGAKTLREAGAPEVRMQTVIVPHWERSDVERAWLRIDGGKAEPLKISALGGSIGTEGVIEAPVRVFRQFEELDSLGEEGLDGAIAFFNRPMDPLMISAGGAYGGANNQRSRGAVEAADHGGVAALVRSLTHALDTFPHTGAMRYDDAVHRVPAAAVSTVDARRIAGLLSDGHDVRVGLEMGCILHDDKAQANVIAEWTGTEHPDRYIVVGGHLDSWDIGEGAHDDGAGIVHSIEVMRTLVALGYQPRHTIRPCSSSMRRMATMAVRPMPARPGRWENGMWRHSRAMPEGMPRAGPSMRRMRGPRRSEPGANRWSTMAWATSVGEEPEWTSVR